MSNNNVKTEYQPEVQIISMRDFNEKNEIGGLMFPSKYYDCFYYCDKKQLYKTFKKELQNKKIVKVLTITENYEKIQNKKIKYRCPLFCEDLLPGSYYLPEWNSFITDYPYGKVIILTKGEDEESEEEEEEESEEEKSEEEEKQKTKNKKRKDRRKRNKWKKTPPTSLDYKTYDWNVPSTPPPSYTPPLPKFLPNGERLN